MRSSAGGPSKLSTGMATIESPIRICSTSLGPSWACLFFNMLQNILGFRTVFQTISRFDIQDISPSYATGEDLLQNLSQDIRFGWSSSVVGLAIAIGSFIREWRKTPLSDGLPRAVASFLVLRHCNKNIGSCDPQVVVSQN